jgi:hypothetical protein
MDAHVAFLNGEKIYAGSTDTFVLDES